MLDVRRLRPTDWPLYRELRLAALAEAPDAFGSTLEREAAFSDAHWRERLERADPGTSHPLVAVLDDVPCALAWAMVDRERARVVRLFQMWVAPSARGHGIGRCLVDACVGWAASRGGELVLLDCSPGNAPAMRLYERCGFVAIGEPEPLREGSDVTSVRLQRRVAPDERSGECPT